MEAEGGKGETDKLQRDKEIAVECNDDDDIDAPQSAQPFDVRDLAFFVMRFVSIRFDLMCVHLEFEENHRHTSIE